MKSKIFIFALLAIFLMSSISAIETTQNNPDSYFCDVGVDDCSKIFDDDWTTSTFNPGGVTGNVYMNYSKPLNIQGATWDIKVGISASFAQQTGYCWDGASWLEVFNDQMFPVTRNYTLPEECISQDQLQLRLEMDSQIGKFVHFYEEQIRWETDGNEIVGFNETLQLPQLESSVEIDNIGLERTYLYCTWRIDGEGEEASQMSSTSCPEQQESFTFLNDETYYTRIDSADIFWNTATTQWEILEISAVDESTIEYNLDIPEPPQSLFDDIFDQIFNAVKSILCQLFPSLGMCNP